MSGEMSDEESAALRERLDGLDGAYGQCGCLDVGYHPDGRCDRKRATRYETDEYFGYICPLCKQEHHAPLGVYDREGAMVIGVVDKPGDDLRFDPWR
jgi:hypothetical protein